LPDGLRVALADRPERPANDPIQGETVVSIDSDANQDLALTGEDAEGVVGGKNAKKAKKAAAKHKAATHAATYTVTYIDSPGLSGPAQPYTSDGDDCDDPGDAGSADTSSPST
jgi:hypothetical protein